MTGLIAQLPAWQLIDPLVVLDQLDEGLDDDGGKAADDDSLESLLEANNASPYETSNEELDQPPLEK